MNTHKTGTREEWLAARLKLLEDEKKLTRRSDELARQRHALPWVPVDKQYTFQTEHGRKTLSELFEGRSQLVIYQFMFGPDYKAGCPACSATADSFNGVLSHLNACDVTMICISSAPLEKLLAYRKRMGWSFNWVSSQENDFNFDYGVSAGEKTNHGGDDRLLEANELKFLRLLNEQPSFREDPPLIPARNANTSGTTIEGYLSEGHGFSTFVLEDDTIYHCYSTYARGTEFLMGYYAVLDRAPRGRNEGDQPMSWLQRHDEYKG